LSITDYPHVSLTHGFFFSMGGFVSRDTKKPITTIAQLHEEPGYLSAIQATPREEIMDKSKGDGLSKGIALMQGLWFIVQIIARAAQRLPVSELEITTLAFAVVNIFVWVLWWHKPLDVQQPILIASGRPHFDPLGRPQAELKALKPNIEDAEDRPLMVSFERNPSDATLMHGLLPGEHPLHNEGWDPLLPTVDEVGSDSDAESSRTSQEDNISHGIQIHVPPPILPTRSPTPPRRRRDNPFLETLFFGPVQGIYPHYEPRPSHAVPEFWSSHDEPQPRTAFAGMLVGVVFGAIHCAAWNASFPSLAERILWRVSAVAVAGYPALLVIPHAVGHVLWGGNTHDHVPFASQVLGVALYALFRIILIVLPFTTLRAVGEGWLVDVDWTLYIPHL
jgi:hypothetical protein